MLTKSLLLTINPFLQVLRTYLLRRRRRACWLALLDTFAPCIVHVGVPPLSLCESYADTGGGRVGWGCEGRVGRSAEVCGEGKNGEF